MSVINLGISLNRNELELLTVELWKIAWAEDGLPRNLDVPEFETFEIPNYLVLRVSNAHRALKRRFGNCKELASEIYFSCYTSAGDITATRAAQLLEENKENGWLRVKLVLGVVDDGVLISDEDLVKMWNIELTEESCTLPTCQNSVLTQDDKVHYGHTLRLTVGAEEERTGYICESCALGLQL